MNRASPASSKRCWGSTGTTSSVEATAATVIAPPRCCGASLCCWISAAPCSPPRRRRHHSGLGRRSETGPASSCRLVPALLLQLVGALLEFDRNFEKLRGNLSLIAGGQLTKLPSLASQIANFVPEVCHRFLPFFASSRQLDNTKLRTMLP